MQKHNLKNLIERNEMPALKSTLAVIGALALPTIFEQIMVTMVQFVDTAMVGSLGSDATAAIGVTASTTWMFGGFLHAVSIGFSVQVAHQVGAKDYSKAKSIVAQSMKVIIIFGLFMATVGISIAPFLPTWLGADPSIKSEATKYFLIMSATIPFNLCILMLGSVIRSSGDTKTPMLLNLLINVLNVLCNFLFIFPTRQIVIFNFEFTMWGAGLGVVGAALGSALAIFLVSFCFVLIVYLKKSDIKLSKGISYKLEKKCISTAAKIGVPVACERFLISFAQVLITATVASLGNVAIAANHLAVTAEALSYLPAMGVGTAATVLIGQAMGANKKELALKFGKIVNVMGIVIMSLAGVFLFVFAEQLIGLFSNEAAVVALGGNLLRIVALAQPFFAMSIVISGVLRGAGDTKTTFLINLITMWGVRITLALILVNNLGLIGVWIAMAVELAVRGLLFLIRLYSKRWLKTSVLS